MTHSSIPLQCGLYYKFPMKEAYDALVLGTGLAGLQFCLRLVEVNPRARVLLVTKSKDPLEGATNWAQGGIAAAVDSAVDSHSKEMIGHAEDTLRTGGGLCDPAAVKLVVEEGPNRIRDLIAWGVPFTKREGKEQEYDLTQEGGHTSRRILHVADYTGKAIMETLLKRVIDHPQITVRTDTTAVDLVTDAKLDKKHSIQNAICLGAYLLDNKTNKVYPVSAPVTLLATGGAGKVYKYTSNPDTSVGDGIAMAQRLGARVANMEFIQFHPTCLFHPIAKSALLSEALRGEGAHLLNRAGERFMPKYDSRGEMAPRDIVALSIDKEMKRRGDESVYLDISHRGEAFVKSHFPHNHETCLRFGFDLTKEPVPVVPAAHYTCGGVMTDLDGSTGIRGLYVSGEAAYTGLHGANRLASNSLLEAAVFSHRAANHASGLLIEGATSREIPDWNPGFAKDEEEEVIISHNWDEVRTVMWNYVGIVRSNRRLEYASRRISLLKQEVNRCYWERKISKNMIELRNLVTIADLIVQSAQMRKESRGLHQNIDYPETDDRLFGKPTVI